MKKGRFPELKVCGSPREMGRDHGEACRQSIGRFLDLGIEQVNRSSSLSRTEAMGHAARYIPFVADYGPDMLEELRGIAEGAGISLEEAMFLQVRTQLMNPPGEGCTAFALERKATAEGSPLIGQNWDWDPSLEEVCIVLRRYPKGKPAFMSFTQVGLIAYMGLNSEGISVCMNLLKAQGYRYGVPPYFIVRSICEQASSEGCIQAAERAHRAMSQNVLVGTLQGAIDLEMTVDRVAVLSPSPVGRLVHTNHFLDADLEACDELVYELPDTLSRYSRINRMLDDLAARPSVDTMKRLMADHEGYPSSICRHVGDDPQYGYMTTVASIIMEPAEGRMHLSRGNPCRNPYEAYQLD